MPSKIFGLSVFLVAADAQYPASPRPIPSEPTVAAPSRTFVQQRDEIVASADETLTAAVDAASNALTHKRDEIVGSANENLNAAVDAVSNTLEQQRNEIVASANEAVDAAVQQKNEIVTSANENLNAAVDAVSNTLEEQRTAATENLNAAVDAVSNTLTQQRNAAEENLNAAVEAAVQQKNEIVASANENVNAAVTSVSNTLEQSRKAAKENVNNAVASVSNMLTQHRIAAEEKLNAAVTSASNALTKQQNEIVASANENLNTAVQTTRVFVDETTQVVQNANQSIQNANPIRFVNTLRSRDLPDWLKETTFPVTATQNMIYGGWAVSTISAVLMFAVVLFAVLSPIIDTDVNDIRPHIAINTVSHYLRMHPVAIGVVWTIVAMLVVIQNSIRFWPVYLEGPKKGEHIYANLLMCLWGVLYGLGTLLVGDFSMDVNAPIHYFGAWLALYGGTIMYVFWSIFDNFYNDCTNIFLFRSFV